LIIQKEKVILQPITYTISLLNSHSKVVNMSRDLYDLSLTFSCSNDDSLDEFHLWLDRNKDDRNLMYSAANYRNEHNDTPLHQLVLADPPSDVLESIIQLAPDTVKAQNDHGYLPLHEACLSKASIDVVSMLIKAYPMAAEVKDERGMLPLHLACLKNDSIEVIQVLLEAYSKAAEVKDFSGSIPLHYVRSNDTCQDVIRLLLHAFPMGAEIQNNDGMLPLHLACMKRLPSEVIIILLEAYPKAAVTQDYFGFLPLHYGRNNGASQSVLKLLYDAFNESLKKSTSIFSSSEMLAICFRVAVGLAPISEVNTWINENIGDPVLLQKAANYRDGNNNTPLHFILAARPPIDLVDKLLQLAPSTVQDKNNYQLTPLHVACHYYASLDVIQKLLDVYPKAAAVAEMKGSLPIHIACTRNCSFNVIKVLLQAYPEAVQIQDHCGKKLVEVMDHNGMLLLHHACYNGLSIDMLQVLVDANPEACLVKDSIGRQPWQLLRINGAAARRHEEGIYPLHIACRKKVSLHLLKLLLDAYPDCSLKMDDYGKTPSQLLEDSGVAAQRDMNEMLLLHHVCSDFCNEDPSYNLKLFFKLILDAYPKGKNVFDKDNMSPLHHACARANSEEALHLLVTSLVTSDCEPSINAKDRFGRTPLCILMSRTDPAQVHLNTKSLAEIVEVIVSSKVIEHLVNMGANIYLGDAEKNQVSKMFLCTLLSFLLFFY